MSIDKSFFGENYGAQKQKNEEEAAASGVTPVVSVGGGAPATAGVASPVATTTPQEAQAPKFSGVKRFLEANKGSQFGKKVAEDVDKGVKAFGANVATKQAETTAAGKATVAPIATEDEVKELSSTAGMNILDAGTFDKFQNAGKKWSAAAHAASTDQALKDKAALEAAAGVQANIGGKSTGDLLTSLYGKTGGTKGRALSSALAQATGGAEIAAAQDAAKKAGDLITAAEGNVSTDVDGALTASKSAGTTGYDTAFTALKKAFEGAGIPDPEGHADGLLQGKFTLDQLKGTFGDTAAKLAGITGGAAKGNFASAEQQAETIGTDYGLTPEQVIHTNAINSVIGKPPLKKYVGASAATGGAGATSSVPGTVTGTQYKQTDEYKDLTNQALTLNEQLSQAGLPELDVMSKGVTLTPEMITDAGMSLAKAKINKATAPKGISQEQSDAKQAERRRSIFTSRDDPKNPNGYDKNGVFGQENFVKDYTKFHGVPPSREELQRRFQQDIGLFGEGKVDDAFYDQMLAHAKDKHFVTLGTNQNRRMS